MGFLTTQSNDLVVSIESLNQTINRINRTSRERFRTAFDAVSQNFVKVFTHLFGGGKAELRLTGDDDVLEAGLEIVAQPPGKRLQNINLLSGGEKALTALSLLFALFQYKPSPFCILDEIDAPLDDANIDRFSKIIYDFSANTQFIIVTHNKRTMEAARTMYGVTMQDEGISKLVSVMFNEDFDFAPQV